MEESGRQHASLSPTPSVYCCGTEVRWYIRSPGSMTLSYLLLLWRTPGISVQYQQASCTIKPCYFPYTLNRFHMCTLNVLLKTYMKTQYNVKGRGTWKNFFSVKCIILFIVSSEYDLNF